MNSLCCIHLGPEARWQDQLAEGSLCTPSTLMCPTPLTVGLPWPAWKEMNLHHFHRDLLKPGFRGKNTHLLDATKLHKVKALITHKNEECRNITIHRLQEMALPGQTGGQYSLSLPGARQGSQKQSVLSKGASRRRLLRVLRLLVIWKLGRIAEKSSPG